MATAKDAHPLQFTSDRATPPAASGQRRRRRQVIGQIPLPSWGMSTAGGYGRMGTLGGGPPDWLGGRCLLSRRSVRDRWLAGADPRPPDRRRGLGSYGELVHDHGAGGDDGS